MDYNLYWDASRRPVMFAQGSLDDWQKRGHDLHSLIADPQLANPAQSDFTLPANSPALKLGFQMINLSTVGPRFPTGPVR